MMIISYHKTSTSIIVSVTRSALGRLRGRGGFIVSPRMTPALAWGIPCRRGCPQPVMCPQRYALLASPTHFRGNVLNTRHVRPTLGGAAGFQGSDLSKNVGTTMTVRCAPAPTGSRVPVPTQGATPITNRHPARDAAGWPANKKRVQSISNGKYLDGASRVARSYGTSWPLAVAATGLGDAGSGRLPRTRHTSREPRQALRTPARHTAAVSGTPGRYARCVGDMALSMCRSARCPTASVPTARLPSSSSPDSRPNASAPP